MLDALKHWMKSAMPIAAALMMTMVLAGAVQAYDDEDYDWHSGQHHWHGGPHHEWHSGHHEGWHGGVHGTHGMAGIMAGIMASTAVRTTNGILVAITTGIAVTTTTINDATVRRDG